MASFSYEGEGSTKQCLAYIDADGDLIILDNGGNGVAVLTHNIPDGDGPAISDAEFDPNDAGVKARLYAGDKITITF